MTLEFGLVVPAGPPKDNLAAWSHLLDTALPRLAGTFTSLWMTDHFFWDDLPTYEAWTVISYLAARYPAFQIGPIVLGQGYRNPALTAKMVATLHALTGGRVIMGIGAGWKEDEYHAYGYPFPSPGVRVGQLEDTLEIFHRLWTQPGPVSYEGAFYRVQSAWCEPRPHPRPPLLVGGGGSKTMQLAVRYADLWNMPDAPYPLYAERVALLRQHCAAARRDPATLRLSWFGRLSLARTEAAAIDRTGGRWTADRAFVGTPAQVIDQMRPFVQLGCDYFMVEVPGLPDAEVLAMLLDEVLPALHAL